MNDQAVKRTLAAIVMADVVGYSRMMGEDEAGTLRRLTQYRSEFIDPTITKHGGRIVNAIGDSLLLEFGSVIDATLCAIELQASLGDRNAAVTEPKRIAFRMGVNIGDVIVQNRSLFGDSVNVAARLQELAEPGGICLSSAAYEQIRGKIEAAFVDIGPHQVKNIARPVVAFALSAQAIGAVPRQSPPEVGTSRRWLMISAGALCLLVVVAFGANYFLHREVKLDLAVELDSAISQAQATLNERARKKLVADYIAIDRHRAFAIAPKAQNHWWTGDWPTAGVAEQKVLERCQIAFNEPCELVAVDDAMTPRKGVNAHIAHDMAKVEYSGDFDPDQIPGIRKLVGKRADVAGYLQAPEPKAAAIHPRGVLAIVTGAASQSSAESQALKLCNENDARKEGDGSCYLYAEGNKVVLPQRQTSPIAKP
jgi:class 3 adenylate cyclase